MKWKLYLAASWPRLKEIREYATILENQGALVTSTWLSEDPNKDLSQHDDPSIAEMITRNIKDLRRSNGLVLFTDGEKQLSKGGRHFEFGFVSAMKLPVFLIGPHECIFHYGLEQYTDFDQFTKYFFNENGPPCLLDKAKTIVIGGERRDVYGHPYDDFKTSATMISTYLTRRKGKAIIILPIDIPAIMVIMKLARLAKSPRHEDSWVDVAGYAQTAELVMEREHEALYDILKNPAPSEPSEQKPPSAECTCRSSQPAEADVEIQVESQKDNPASAESGPEAEGASVPIDGLVEGTIQPLVHELKRQNEYLD